VIKNSINLLFSKFELSWSFDNSFELIMLIIFEIKFIKKTHELFMINEYNEKS